MVKLVSSIEQDIERLTRWIAADPYHKDCLDPFWWLTGNGVLSYHLEDSHGPTMYARLDEDSGLLRLHCQFGPESEVSKIRTVKSLLWAIPKMEYFAKTRHLEGFIYKSVSPSLISFMETKFGFVAVLNDDHVKLFEEQ